MDRLYSESDVVITIVAPADADDDIPGYISDTPESNAVDFEVVSKPLPEQRRMFDLLSSRFGQITLSAYRQGQGRFFVADAEPPVMGEVINLSETLHIPQVELEDYFDALYKHDWFFSYSDDRNISERGAKEEARLSAIAQSHGGDFQKLMRAFRAYHFSGKAWNTNQAPKPLRPVDGQLRFEQAPSAPQDEPECIERDVPAEADDGGSSAPARDRKAEKGSASHDAVHHNHDGQGSKLPASVSVPELVNWEVSSALDVYKAWLVRSSYRNWSHQLLCWAGSPVARDIDAELTMAEQRAREIVNRTESHTAAAMLIARRETCAPQDAARFMALCQAG